MTEEESWVWLGECSLSWHAESYRLCFINFSSFVHFELQTESCWPANRSLAKAYTYILSTSSSAGFAFSFFFFLRKRQITMCTFCYSSLQLRWLNPSILLAWTDEWKMALKMATGILPRTKIIILVGIFMMPKVCSKMCVHRASHT